VSLEELGDPDGLSGPEARNAWLLQTLREAVGPEGTLLVPTYTFSFFRQEPFDVEGTPTEGGAWSASRDFLEFFRRQPGAVRSRDRSLVAGWAPGRGCWRTFRDVLRSGQRSRAAPPAKDLRAGNRLFGSELPGHVGLAGAVSIQVLQRRDPSKRCRAPAGDLQRADRGRTDSRTRGTEKARAAGVCRARGPGRVLAVSARELFDLTRAELKKDPWFTARGPACDPVEAEDRRIGSRRVDVALPPEATMDQMIQGLWQLPRHLISDGYDTALRALGTQLPMTIHEYPTGTECWTWIIPEKWTCHEAYLETLDGKRLFSAADLSLHVVNYSLPFEGVVTRDELFRHLHVHPRVPDAVPFILMYYERDWGSAAAEAEERRDERYRVVIKTSFTIRRSRSGRSSSRRQRRVVQPARIWIIRIRSTTT
jgi:hypothetical protein